MDVLNTLATHVIESFEGNNWTDVCIADAIKDVTWQQAQQKTNASTNTIAALLHHLYYWNGILMQRIKGDDPSIPETNGFDAGELKNENDWKELKEKTHASFLQLAGSIKIFPEEKLQDTYAEEKSSYYKNFQGIIEHTYYHLGQMIILKKLIKNNN